MYTLTAVVALALTLAASDSSADQRAPLRCYICVTDYEDNTQEPGCSVSNPSVIVRACAVQHGYDSCISYRARNTRTGNVVFRRHCATRVMCEYQCLFSHHTNCQKTCCQGDLCNDVNFEGYVKPSVPNKTPTDPIKTTQSPQTASKRTNAPVTPIDPIKTTQSPQTASKRTNAPVTPIDPIKTTQSPHTVSKRTNAPVASTEDQTQTSKSSHTPAVSKRTTKAPATTQEIFSTDKSLVGGPPAQSRCLDYRYECPRYAAYPGYCQYTRDFMLLHCPKSCRFCVDTGTKASTESPTRPTKSPTTASVPDTTQDTKGTTTEKVFIGGPTGCVDTREQCSYFANKDGYCDYHYGFMLTYCQRSCNMCENDEVLPESPVKKATAKNLPITKARTSEQVEPEPTPVGSGGEIDRKETEQFQEKPTRFGPGGEDYQSSGCIDLRENCTHYATQYDEYCNYNIEFMAIYCPFSCGFCGATVPDGAFPHPPVLHQHPTNQEFPAPPSKKDARWLTSFCSECHHGYQECIAKCILLLKDGIYEPTSNHVCIKLLGEPNEMIPC